MLNVLTELQNLGLSDKEAGIYFAALEMGQATADQLAKHSKVKRSTAYAYIESLMNKGLMSSFESGRKTYFAPESPKNIERLFDTERKNLDKRKEELQEVLPDLTQLFEGAGERPTMRFFTGKEGIITMREEVLLSKSKIVRVFFAADAMVKLFSEAEREAYIKKRTASGIQVKLLYTRSDGPFTSEAPLYTERRYLDYKNMSLGADIVIYNDKVSLISLVGKPFGVIIQSREIAKSILTMFDLIWITTKENK